MRKRLKKHKLLVPVAIIFGLLIGLLIIPSIKHSFNKPVTTVVENVVAPEATSIPTTAQILDQNNWVEYRNEEFDLSFKYPNGLIQNIFNEPNQEITYYNGITFGRMKAPHGTVYDDTLKKLGYEIMVKVDRATTLNEEILEMDKYNNRPEFKKETITVDSVPAYRYTGTGMDWYRTTVLFERNKKLYSFTLIRFTEEGEFSDEGKQLFDLIIKSIKF